MAQFQRSPFYFSIYSVSQINKVHLTTCGNPLRGFDSLRAHTPSQSVALERTRFAGGSLQAANRLCAYCRLSPASKRSALYFTKMRTAIVEYVEVWNATIENFQESMELIFSLGCLSFVLTNFFAIGELSVKPSVVSQENIYTS